MNAEQLAAFLSWCEARSARIEVFPGDVLNPQLSGWTARVQGFANPGSDRTGFSKEVESGTPHGALALLMSQVLR